MVLLGAISGAWFKVQVLIPLVAIVFIELAILKHSRMLSSVLWSAIVLIGTLETGYLIGSALAALWLFPVRERAVRDFTRHDLPLNIHPAAIRVSAVDTPFGAV